MKTKNSSAAPRDSTQGLIRYLNYFLEFPDGEVWHDSVGTIAGGLNAWIVNTTLYKTKPDAALKLVAKGEAHWKDQNGVTHRMVISTEAVGRKWGLNKKIRRKSAIDLT